MAPKKTGYDLSKEVTKPEEAVTTDEEMSVEQITELVETLSLLDITVMEEKMRKKIQEEQEKWQIVSVKMKSLIKEEKKEKNKQLTKQKREIEKADKKKERESFITITLRNGEHSIVLKVSQSNTIGMVRFLLGTALHMSRAKSTKIVMNHNGNCVSTSPRKTLLKLNIFDGAVIDYTLPSNAPTGSAPSTGTHMLDANDITSLMMNAIADDDQSIAPEDEVTEDEDTDDDEA